MSDALSHAERFGQLRSLLHQPPSPQGWEAIARLLPAWALPQLRDEILPYLSGFWSAWSPHAALPPVWLDTLDDAQLDALASLTSHIALECVPGCSHEAIIALARRAGEAGWLRHMRDVRLKMTLHDDVVLRAEEVIPWLGEALERLALDELLIDRTDCDRLRDIAPNLRVLSITNYDLDTDEIDALLPQLEAIDLSHTSVYETSAPPLWPFDASRLRTLKLRRTLGEPPFGQQLATSKALAGLRALDVSDNLLQDEDILHLVHTAPWSLRALDISCNEQCTTERVAEVLEAGALEGLRALGVANLVGGESASSVMRLARSACASSLYTLDIGLREHVPEVVETLLDSFPALRELRLSGCELSPDALRTLLTTPAPPPLRALDLRDPPLALLVTPLQTILDAPWLPQLTRLDLRVEAPARREDTAQHTALQTIAAAIREAHPTVEVLCGLAPPRAELDEEREGWSLDELMAWASPPQNLSILPPLSPRRGEG